MIPMRNEPDQESRPLPSPWLGRIIYWFRFAVALPIWLYQKLVSPGTRPSCIYTPTCSEYTRQAVMRFGLIGIVMGVLRVLRCVGELYTGGADPLPDRLTLGYLFGSYRRFWRHRR